MRIISLAVAAAFTVLSAVALAQTDAPKQTETAKGNTGAYALPQIDEKLEALGGHLLLRGVHQDKPDDFVRYRRVVDSTLRRLLAATPAR